MLIKTIFKFKQSRIWAIVTSAVLVFLLIASLVVTQSVFINGTLDAVFGGERIFIKNGDKYKYYTSDYENKADALASANALNEQIEEEGIVLLKNEGSLPLKTPESDATVSGKPRISVFGKNSVNLVYGGSGSSSEGAPTVYDSLENAGYSVNPTLKSYGSSASGAGRPSAVPSMGDILTGYPIGETPVSMYYDAVRKSFAEYSDAAIVVLSRIGGEGYDLPRTMKMNSKGNYKAGFSDKSAWSSTTARAASTTIIFSLTKMKPTC